MIVAWSIGLVFCVVNTTLALVSSNWHSAMGWGVALLYAIVLVGNELEKSKEKSK